MTDRINITIDFTNEEKEHLGVRQVARTLVSGWESLKDEEISLKRFTAGITNRLYRATAKGFHVLVRIYGLGSELLIDREHELKIISAMHELGFAPKLYGCFQNGYAYGYFEGRSLEIEELSKAVYNKKVGSYLGKWHRTKPQIGNQEPTLWKTIHKWLNLVPSQYNSPEKQMKFEKIDFNKVKQEALFLEKELDKLNSPVVFSHDDLLAGNIVVDESVGEVHFIDFEYANYNFRAFDIANHFCEWAGFDGSYHRMPTIEQQRDFYVEYLESYLGATPSENQIHELSVEVNKFMLASDFFWGSWSLVQGHISAIDFDFVEYAGVRFRHYFDTKEKQLSLK